MFAAASGNVDAVTPLIEAGAERQRDGVGARTDAGDVRGGVQSRRRCSTVLAKHGADLKATSKVTDLAALSRDPAALRAFTHGNPAAARRAAGRAGATAPAAGAGAAAAAAAAAAAPDAGVDRNYQLNELVAAQGGLTPLLFAAREGHAASVQRAARPPAPTSTRSSAGDHDEPAADRDDQRPLRSREAAARARAPIRNAASENNATALYAALNCEWAPKALYPQPRAQLNQQTTYLELMKALLDKGADPNVRLNKKIWYSGYSFDLSGVDETGATPFWRAAYASDVDAMKMLVAYGADPNIRTKRSAGPSARRRRRPRREGRLRAAAGRRSAAPRSRRCRQPPASATAKASPPTHTASRPAACWPP